jgi:hypothetical protein
MKINLSFDRILSLLGLLAVSSVISFCVYYWFGGNLLMCFSTGVGVTLQLNNIFNPQPQPNEEVINEDQDINTTGNKTQEKKKRNKRK